MIGNTAVSKPTDDKVQKRLSIEKDTPIGNSQKTSLQITNNMDWRLESLNEKQILQYFSLKIAFGANIMFTLEAAEKIVDIGENLLLTFCNCFLVENMSDNWFVLTPSLIKDEHEESKKNDNMLILENHIKYYLDLAELCERHLSDRKEKDPSFYINILTSNLQNYRITLQYCLMLGNYIYGIRIILALTQFFLIQRLSKEGFGWGTAILDMDPSLQARTQVDSQTFLYKAKGHQATAKLGYKAQKYVESKTQCEKAILEFQIVGAMNEIPSLHNLMGKSDKKLQKLTSALKYHMEARAGFEKLSDSNNLSLTSYYLGNVKLEQGDIKSAKQHHNSALSMRRISSNDQVGTARSLLMLGKILFYCENDYSGSKHNFEESLKLFQSLNHEKGVTSSCLHLGLIAIKNNNLNDAHKWLLESLQRAAKLGDKTLLCESLEGLAALGSVKKSQWAMALFGFCEKWRGEDKITFKKIQIASHVKLMNELKSFPNFYEAWAGGQVLDVQAAVELAANASI